VKHPIKNLHPAELPFFRGAKLLDPVSYWRRRAWVRVTFLLWHALFAGLVLAVDPSSAFLWIQALAASLLVIVPIYRRALVRNYDAYVSAWKTVNAPAANDGAPHL
jgi:hypothetical protein